MFDNGHEVHNTYLCVLIEHGVVAFLLLVAFITLALIAAYKSARGTPLPANRILITPWAVAFIVVLIYGLSHFGLRKRPFWIAAGLLLSTAEIRTRGA